MFFPVPETQRDGEPEFWSPGRQNWSFSEKLWKREENRKKYVATATAVAPAVAVGVAVATATATATAT